MENPLWRRKHPWPFSVHFHKIRIKCVKSPLFMETPHINGYYGVDAVFVGMPMWNMHHLFSLLSERDSGIFKTNWRVLQHTINTQLTILKQSPIHLWWRLKSWSKAQIQLNLQGVFHPDCDQIPPNTGHLSLPSSRWIGWLHMNIICYPISSYFIQQKH